MDWLSDLWVSLTLVKILAIIGAMAVSFSLSFLAVSLVLIHIPKNFFSSDYEHHFFSNRHPVLRWVAVGSKNILGLCLIVAGIALSLPGIPGPGFLTIFIGLILTDIPGKRSLEVKLISRPSLLAAVNKLREKYNRDPLQLDQ